MESKTAESSAHTGDLRLLTGCFLILLIAMHLILAATGRSIMREQHLGTAVEFAKGSIDLLHPLVLGANANDVPTILQFPIWEAITAVLMKAFGIWYGMGNVVSLMFHISALWPVIQLGRRFLSERGAWWAALFYIAQPLTFVWGGMASADSAAAALAVWFGYAGLRALNSFSWARAAAAVVLGVLSATTKAPFFMTVGVALAFYVLQNHRRSPRHWILLCCLGGMPGLAFVAWNHYGNACVMQADFPLFASTSVEGRADEAFNWWFGGWRVRLNPVFWAHGIWRFLIILLGSAALLVLPAAGYRLARGNFIRCWAVAGLCTTLVFTNVILIHWHYFFLFAVPVALLTAAGAMQLEGPVATALSLGVAGRTVFTLLLVGSALFQGIDRSSFRMEIEGYNAEQGAIIRQHTAPGDRLLVWGAGWGIPFMHADRHGLTFSKMELIENPQKFGRLKGLGYTHLILMNRSPVEVGSLISSGQIKKAFDLPAMVPPVAGDWPIVYKSENLLIVKIPK